MAQHLLLVLRSEGDGLSLRAGGFIAALVGIALGCGNRRKFIHRLERRKNKALTSQVFVRCCRSRCAWRRLDGAACAPADVQLAIRGNLHSAVGSPYAQRRRLADAAVDADEAS
jgi:hypothetical protein